jgi:hypothetical protein
MKKTFLPPLVWQSGVNLTSILCAAFAPISFFQKMVNPNCKHTYKSCKKHFCRKKLFIKCWKKLHQESISTRGEAFRV